MSVTTTDGRTDGRIPADTFGIRLVVIRHEMRLTVDEISSMCGIASATWSTWEHGTRPRDLAQAVRAISAALGYSRDWLMWGSEFPLSGQVEPDHLDLEWAEYCTGQLTLQSTP